ncbi:MAG TPA: hypothetical protein VK714_14845 [Myxococcota bacterium]|nr:hypothetical protein [Myxococcota bacterium]
MVRRLLLAASLLAIGLPSTLRASDFGACRATLGSLEWDAGDAKRAADDADYECGEFHWCQIRKEEDCSAPKRECASARSELTAKLAILADSLASVKKGCFD